MGLVVHSPSNLAQFRDCPKKYWGQRAKLIQWRESPQKLRGTAVHAALEQALNEGVQAVKAWPDGMNTNYTLTTLQSLRTAAAQAELHTEHEMCVTREFKSVGWWDNDAYLRAKADLLLVRPEEYAMLGDWKTGRMYPGSDMQLRTEALLVHVLYKVPVVEWRLFYVDQGETKSGTVDFTKGIAQVKDIVELMHTVEHTVEQGGPFPSTKNKFCKWCDFYHGQYCDASRNW